MSCLCIISSPSPAAMFACVLLYVVIVQCVIVKQDSIEPLTEYKEDLSPLLITCNLNDIVTISTPRIKFSSESLYYLHNPNDEITQLNITFPEEASEEPEFYEYSMLKNKDRIIYPKTSYRIDKVNFGYRVDFDTIDEFGMEGDEFVIGPLMEEDHGNWVLSIFISEDATYIELFQVITIEIIEQVPMELKTPEVDPGDTLRLRFAYPIKHLESCQLIVPKSTYDRSYELASNEWCAYIVRNVTQADAGTWEIRGVGRVVYEARTQLKVRNKGT